MVKLDPTYVPLTIEVDPRGRFRVDYPLLEEQRRHLAAVIAGEEKPIPEKLEGLQGMLDAVSDSIWEVLGDA